MNWNNLSLAEMINRLVCLFFISSTCGKQVSKLRRQAGYGGSAGGSSYPAGSSALAGYGSSGSVQLPGYGLGSSGTSSFGLYGSNNVIPAQNPNVFVALDQLRGSDALTATEIQALMSNAYAGTTYPTYSYIPQTTFSCSQVKQFGFYADTETRCQVFRRCEANNYMFSYICPNGTLFNQITLVCDWWFNVNCPK
ncbi:hypothetical protein RvY_05550-2 [Ramazzottius varieornatus]|uniref:Chitin-binding type-2 domain-containing protein n=1 Tax=Ramazzottius varieornatus TaxID=947166 RepID=A0A1D1V112_RAMVA|nr:hypothetical protein RvY_05550-2 [Ramazzottius varieornatus]